MSTSQPTLLTRRAFVATTLLGVAALGLGARNPLRPLLLIRYDVESRNREGMRGFFEKMIAVHRVGNIPATIFCMGAAMELRDSEFREFFAEVKDDPLFDIQDHSYSHVGVGYEHGRAVDELRVDFSRSFAVHERLRGARPVGVSLAGTGNRDGERLAGFDATAKTRAELDMLAGLGVRLINTFHRRVDGTKTFINYRDLGHPEVMGFPSGNGDNSWLRGRRFGEPREYITGLIRACGRRQEHVPIMLHDDTVWIDLNDRKLEYVRLIAATGRAAGFELVTHLECYRRKSLWADFVRPTEVRS